MEQNLRLTNDQGALFEDPTVYWRLVGRLIYLTITRPDIVYLINILSQFMHQPRQPHYDVAVRVLRYLKSSPGKGIILSSSSSLRLSTYFDSNWASCPIMRRSTTGYFTMLGTSSISWKTKKQNTISGSSVEGWIPSHGKYYLWIYLVKSSSSRSQSSTFLTHVTSYPCNFIVIIKLLFVSPTTQFSTSVPNTEKLIVTLKGKN